MARKKLKIKTRRSYKPAVIKKRPPKIKKRNKKYVRNCSYCSHWWEGPEVERAEGETKVRCCSKTGETVEDNHKMVCTHYAGGWVVMYNVNGLIIRDSESPPLIKRRKKKKPSKNHAPRFIVERRHIDAD